MKKKRDGFIINVLLLLIAALTVVFYLVDYSNKKRVKEGNYIIENSDVVVATIQGDEIESTVEKNKKNEIENVPTNTAILNEEVVPKQTEVTPTTPDTSVYRFYYSQLDDNAKKIYTAIDNNIENIKSGTYAIGIPEDVGNVLYQENGEQKLNLEFQSAWDAIIMDRVELFFIDVSKISLEIMTTVSGNKRSFKLSMKPNSNNYLESDFEDSQSLRNTLARLEQTRDNAVRQINGSTYDKIVKVNDTLVDNLSYDEGNGNNAYNIYGALMQRKCVCEGYAESFKYIMDAFEIPCILVIGNGKNSAGVTENHEWNYVLIDDKWYAVDVTWNDPIINGGIDNTPYKHKYLLKGKSIYSNHSPTGKISNNGMIFGYPELSESDYR